MLHGCRISFHQPNVIFGVVWDWLLADRVTVVLFFDFYYLNAKILNLNQHQPPQSVLKEARCRCQSSSSAPAGQSAAVGGDAAVPPHRFLTWFLAAARRYLGSLLSPHWLRSTHTPRERSLLFFFLSQRFVTLSVSSQPLLFPAVSLSRF